MDGMAAEDKRLKKHVARLQNQTEVRQVLLPTSVTPTSPLSPSAAVASYSIALASTLF